MSQEQWKKDYRNSGWAIIDHRSTTACQILKHEFDNDEEIRRYVVEINDGSLEEFNKNVAETQGQLRSHQVELAMIVQKTDNQVDEEAAVELPASDGVYKATDDGEYEDDEEDEGEDGVSEDDIQASNRPPFRCPCDRPTEIVPEVRRCHCIPTHRQAGIFNIVDNICASQGHILFLTTNKMDPLDEALICANWTTEQLPAEVQHVLCRKGEYITVTGTEQGASNAKSDSSTSPLNKLLDCSHTYTNLAPKLSTKPARKVPRAFQADVKHITQKLRDDVNSVVTDSSAEPTMYDLGQDHEPHGERGEQMDEKHRPDCRLDTNIYWTWSVHGQVQNQPRTDFWSSDIRQAIT